MTLPTLMATFPTPALFAEARTTFEFARIQSNADWLLPLGMMIALLLCVRWMYRRDAAELPAVVSWLLTALRAATLIGLLLLWLEPQWRTEEERVIPSRAVVLVDTSLSMGLTDSDQGPASASRGQQVVSALRQGDFLERLRKTHEVVLQPFNEDVRRDRMLSLPKLPAGAEPAATAAKSRGAAAQENRDRQPAADAADGVAWDEVFRLGGDETRLGQSVQQAIAENSAAPLSGVIVISDGGQNAGPGPEAAIAAARDAGVPIFTVGVGSDKQPPSVRVAAFNPPPRAYPGDPYSVSGVVQAWRLAGQRVQVQLLSRPAQNGSVDKSARGTGELVAAQEIVLGGDGAEVPVQFQVTAAENGRRTLVLKVIAPEADRQRDDNVMEADVEIVDRKTHILLFAGGPSREFQFLRNQLYRDKTVTCDVLLQSAKAGASQEGQKVLEAFPATRDELYAYDCLIAIDPNWRAIPVEALETLEHWVAEQAGGMIVAAGPVYAGEPINGWVQDPARGMGIVRSLYPVEFPRGASRIESKPQELDKPWPLTLTAEGQAADFLQLTDSAAESREAWQSFPGVFGYFPVRGAKPGATVLALFSDPQAAQGGRQPVYLAWQFYGSGRVLYVGSGELWRLRALDPKYFERLYTKLVRHVSKGRLLRGSTRGMLLVGQERYWLGNTVAVQAYRLTDARLNPLDVPKVALQVVDPKQEFQTVELRPDPARPGTYLGQFSALREGEYRLELPLPEGSERLTQRIQVEIPDLERERPQRDDAVLGQLAAGSGGRYFVGLSAIQQGSAGLVECLKDRTKTTILTAAVSKQWEERVLWWVMLALGSLLAAEWLLRRLWRLA